MEDSLKFLRTVQLAMLVSIALYAFIAGFHGPTPKVLSVAFIYSIVALAACMAGAILLVHRIIVKPAESTLVGDADNTAALNRWRAGYIVTFALSEAVALYGIVLRFAGVEFRHVFQFFLASFVLMVFFGPRRPSNALG
jgi:F0F1-type ATP synthase membrane subunit c/vacuolar-type H+-ATPase subunit K